MRAAAPLLRGTFGIMLGRTEGAESECQAALAAFRALGEAWGTAAVPMQLADFAKLRRDYAAAISPLEKAASLGQELGAWGDLSHIAGKLATVQLRAGDLAAARANLERAERGDSERSVGAAKRPSGSARCERNSTSVRGCFNESASTLLGPGIGAYPLGPDEFEIANECGRALSQDDSVAVAACTVANPVKAG